jgi:hypothetical protein
MLVMPGAADASDEAQEYKSAYEDVIVKLKTVQFGA